MLHIFSHQTHNDIPNTLLTLAHTTSLAYEACLFPVTRQFFLIWDLLVLCHTRLPLLHVCATYWIPVTHQFCYMTSAGSRPHASYLVTCVLLVPCHTPVILLHKTCWFPVTLHFSCHMHTVGSLSHTSYCVTCDLLVPCQTPLLLLHANCWFPAIH